MSNNYIVSHMSITICGPLKKETNSLFSFCFWTTRQNEIFPFFWRGEGTSLCREPAAWACVKEHGSPMVVVWRVTHWWNGAQWSRYCLVGEDRNSGEEARKRQGVGYRGIWSIVSWQGTRQRGEQAEENQKIHSILFFQSRYGFCIFYFSRFELFSSVSCHLWIPFTLEDYLCIFIFRFGMF